MYELMVEESFDAAHALRGYEGPCENLHGHTWKVQVFLKGKKLDKIGLLEDFKSIKSELKEVLAEFDHKLLNDLKPFDAENPSSENLAAFIYEQMLTKLPGEPVTLACVEVWESPQTGVSYTPD